MTKNIDTDQECRNQGFVSLAQRNRRTCERKNGEGGRNGEFVRVSPVKHKRMELCSSGQTSGRKREEGFYGRQTGNVFH